MLGNKKRTGQGWSRVCCWAVIWFVCGTGAVAADHGDSGQKFSDPAFVAPVAPGWRDGPIKYVDWAQEADLAVALDQHLFPALSPLIREFAQNNNLEIAIKEGTCGVSAGLLIRRAVDVGGFCCPPSPADRLPGLQFHTIGIGSLALLVNRENPLEGLSLTQARRVFQGRNFRWSELQDNKGNKGPDLPIKVIGRLHCKQRPGHWRLLLPDEDHFSPRMVEVGTIEDMMLSIAGAKGAIGYEVLWNIERFGVRGRVKPLHINGASPVNREALAAGLYPLYRTYNITTWGPGEKASEHGRKLAAFLVQQAENRLDKSFGIVPASRLREQGWEFLGNELVGEPGR